jgi:hypothetical protein
VKYYEHYLKRLRESVARSSMAEQLLPLLDLVDELDRPAEQRFQMVQQLERLIRDLGGSDVDWSAGTELVRQAATEATDADDFRGRLQRIAAGDPPSTG